jgi:hypothetical protein
VHLLRGPLLLDVPAFAGARPPDSDKLVLRGVDGFAVTLSVEKARRRRCMVATRRDGKAMPLGGLGPPWRRPDCRTGIAAAGGPLRRLPVGAVSH